METEPEELVDIDLERFRDSEGIAPGLGEALLCGRPLSISALANCSSATPFFRRRSFGLSLFNLGVNLGLSNCWVRDGRELYGRS